MSDALPVRSAPTASAALLPVVITRPLAQAGALARRIEALGREAILFPLLDIQPLPDTSVLRSALAALDRYALVAFISPNAIDAAMDVSNDVANDLTINAAVHWPPAMPLAVMGEGSRAALARHGLTDANCRIISPHNTERTDSQTLLEALDLDALKGKRVLILRGESGRELLADALRAAGIEVDQVAAYRRVAPPWDAARRQQLRELLARPADWIVTSSEALRILLGWVQAIDGDAGDVAGADGTVVVAMQRQRLLIPHRRIEETARALGLTHTVLTQSGDDGLIAALQSS